LGRALGVLGAAVGRIEKIKVIRIGAIIKKKKATSKGAAKNTGKKKNAKKGKKRLDPAEVRKDIAQMVDWEAAVMVQAVIDEGKKGQLATVKYLLEMAEIYPASTDGSQASAEEDSLARTLLHRLNLPEEPIVRDEEDEPESEERTAAELAKDGGAERESDGESKDPALR
jgi:hypothetical protein